MKHLTMITIHICILTLGWSAFAQETDKTKDQPATLTHQPRTQADAEKDTWFIAEIERDWQLESVWLAVRPLGSTGPFERIAFERSDAQKHIAVVPAAEVQPPGVEYYITSTTSGGQSREHFASADQPQPVYVEGETSVTKRQARLARHLGQTSEFELRGEFTTFGTHQTTDNRAAEVTDTGFNNTVATDPGSDVMWVSELQYTFRPLTLLYDFGFGLGVMRGSTATFSVDDQTFRLGLSGDDPGLNYGFGTATLEFHRNVSMTGRLTLGASARGFAVGGGGVLRLGRIGGTHLALGAEATQDVGSRGYMAFAWDTVPNIPMSLTFEATSLPNPDINPTGLRFIYEIGWEVSDQFTILGDVGYATRTDGLTLGMVGGLKARYGF